MSPVELFWVSVNVLGLSLTLWALMDAQRNVTAVRSMNGAIVGVAARGNLFREQIRLAIQLVFLAVGLFAAADPRQTPLTVPVGLLLSVPVLLVTNTVSELRDRRIIAGKSVAAISLERDRRMERLEDQGAQLSADIAENTRITQQASDNADAAYREANNVNEKIADHGATLVLQGESAAADRLVGQDTNDTAHRIDERVP